MLFSNLFKKVYVVLKSEILPDPYRPTSYTRPVAVHATEAAALRDACVRWSGDLLTYIQENGLSTTHMENLRRDRATIKSMLPSSVESGEWGRTLATLMAIHEEVVYQDEYPSTLGLRGTSYAVHTVLYED